MNSRLIIVICLLLIMVSIVYAENISLEDLEKKVAEIGKLKFLQSVPVRYLKRQEMLRYIESLIEDEYSQEMAEKEMEYGLQMGFYDQPFSLKNLRKKIIGDNIGGLYNEKTKELLALEDFRTIDMFNSLTLIHELRHAVQDQHFSIASLLGKYSEFDDRSLSILAALEGDATLMMIRYMDFDPELIASAFQPQTVFSFALVPGVSSIIDAPDLIKYQLLMPYLDGMRFSTHLYKKLKWEGINKSLKNPPKSTEQILHPEKYLKSENPISVHIRYQPQKWELYFSGVVGEYFLNVLLKSSDEINDVASGWAGDLFNLYKKGESRMLVWKSIWDTPKDMVRFSQDFRRFLERKFEVRFRTGNEHGKEFIAGNSRFGYFFLRKVGQNLIYVRTNDKAEINALINGGTYD